MGVKNLWDILESCKQTLPLHHLQNKRLCVDLSCWLVQLQNASKSQANVKDRVFLRSLFHRLRALIALNCSLILVTDGSIPSIKLSTYRRRLGSISEVTREEINPQPMPSLRRNMGSEFSCMIKEAKVLGLALGIPCVDGLEEAEAQCALLNSASLCDGCFSSDSDIFLFGAKTVYRDIILGEGGYVICYELEDIKQKLGLGRNSLIALALLLGSDYSHGVRGFGPETAYRLVKSIGDDKVLLRVKSEGLAFARKSKVSKKAVKNVKCDVSKENEPFYVQCDGGKSTGSDDIFLQVINAYMKPKCHSPDSDLVQRACTQHPFERAQLQQICTRFFDWSPEKTDEYILPKIAERDLRRFANLRSTSSELGVRIPMDKMAVSCPVSAIVKQRKLQGRDYFEVSWKEMEGLQTSIIPANLIESACPGKIVEFMEKKCEAKKKQTRRPRPTKLTKASVSEVNLQLKNLKLSLESQNNAITDTTKSHKPNNLNNVVGPVAFIDLSSPSPALRACRLAKHQAIINKIEAITEDIVDICDPEIANTEDKHVDVIDISESETDASPEHERKARELRLFISRIREELY